VSVSLRKEEEKSSLLGLVFSLISVEMEAPDTAACFVDDLLDFASDIGEEDDEEEKPRRPLASLDPNPSRLLPVSCFMGHFLGVYLGLGGGGGGGRGCSGR
jgi:hypothetical protein